MHRLILTEFALRFIFDLLVFHLESVHVLDRLFVGNGLVADDVGVRLQLLLPVGLVRDHRR
jgi:hypothetical protein